MSNSSLVAITESSHRYLGLAHLPWSSGLVLITVFLFTTPSYGESPFHSLGRWITEPGGLISSAPTPGSREQGLQTSGLSYHGGFLWSIGDQRSSRPSTLIRIDPEDGSLASPFFPVQVTESSQGPIPTRLKQGNPDFEGLVVTGDSPKRFFAVIESDGCYVVEGFVDTARIEARVTRIFTLDFHPNPAEGSVNSRLEGIAVHGQEVWLAYERDGSGSPYLYRGFLPDDSNELQVKAIPLPLGRLPDRTNKGQLNFNGLELVDSNDPLLVILARDQERLLFYRLRTGLLSVLDLDFRSPEDLRLAWTSPEGVAIDPVEDRLWLVSDPDSQQGNYRLEGDNEATGNFTRMVPLLFEISFTQALQAAEPVD